MIEIIPDIGINHNGDMKIARRLIWEAQQAGCRVAKFQLYDIDKLFPDKKIITQGRNWYNEVKKTQLSYEQAKDLALYCHSLGIEFFASAFDSERLVWLEEVGVKRHKVATRVNTEVPLIRAMVNTGKPVLLSCTNRSSVFQSPHISYLYCVPEYPTPLSSLKFERINFPTQYQGFSDHTTGLEAAEIAIARGAVIVEKHFTLNKDSHEGPDHCCSIEPYELKRLVEFAKRVEEAL